MPFGIKSEGFWGKKELSYQHVHMFWAFWIAYFAHGFFFYWWTPIVVGAACGIAMEVFQNIKHTMAGSPPGSWADTFRDFCFWTLGGCLNYILILSGKVWL